jgi:DNA-binding CsgD family transcriptional regulator
MLARDTINFLRRQDKELVNEGELLTQRQREVLQLLAEGKVMKQVGGILNMATRTVAYHKYRMMDVLGVRSNAELVKYAIKNHIVAAETEPGGVSKPLLTNCLPARTACTAASRSTPALAFTT